MFRLSFILQLFILGSHLSAQDNQIGIKLLPGITNYFNSPSEENINKRFTVNYGLNYTYQIDKKSAIETGLYLVDRGFVRIKDSINVNDNFVHNIYMSIPILYRYEFELFYISIGPVFDYFIHTKHHDKTNQSYEIIKPSANFQSRLGWGVDLNIGHKWKINNYINLFSELSFQPSEIISEEFENKIRGFLNFELAFGMYFKF